MNRYDSIREAIEDLEQCSDTIKELMRMDCFCVVTFGMQDVVNGYGWSYGMVIKVVLKGKMCQRPGCWYDETKPKKQRQEEERDFVLSGRAFMHRHSYTDVEKTVGFWYGIHEETTVREFLEETLKQLQEQY